MSTGNGWSFEERLHRAILNAYNVDDLDQMVQFRLNRRLDQVTPNPKLQQFKGVHPQNLGRPATIPTSDQAGPTREAREPV
jgi:hypothetical protein